MIVTDELYRAYAGLRQALASNGNVYNVGIGLREEGGRLFEEPSLRVYIRDPIATPRFDRDFCGVPVSVIAPRIALCSSPFDPSRHPILMGGIKVSSSMGSGTMGAVVQRSQSKELLGLTCAHVIGLSSLGFGGSVVYQPDFPPFIAPGPLNPADALGEVDQAEGAFQPTPTLPPQFVGVIDAAVFKLDKAQQRTPSRGVVGLVNSITAVADPIITQFVRKRGFATGPTNGVVINVSPPDPAPWLVDNAPPNSFLTGQAEILALPGTPPFAEKGDSGSLVLDASSPTALGILWASGGNRAFMSPIKLVEQRLNISVVW
jgi:hypothetical protein